MHHDGIIPLMNSLSILTLVGCLLFAQSAMAVETLSKDAARKEFRTVYAEASAAKKKYNKIISDLRKAKQPELVAIEKKFMVSAGPINKAVEAHPDFAELRAVRDKATADWEQATKARDQDAAKKAVKERSAAKTAITKAYYAHKDIIPLIKAREALGKEREAVKKKLVTEKDPELVKKIDTLEKRKAELLKIIRA